MSEPIITKRCGHCKTTKPTSDFYRNRAQKDGFCPQCKDCQKAYNHSEAGRVTQKRKRSSMPIYRIWAQIHQRCRNKQSQVYNNYGGRGIKVCKRWYKFKNFLADMGPTYKTGLTIERVDNNGDYCPENCCWATRGEQAMNKRTNHLLTYCGKTQPLTVWARELGIPYTTILERIRRGWDTERSLSEPVHVESRHSYSR